MIARQTSGIQSRAIYVGECQTEAVGSAEVSHGVSQALSRLTYALRRHYPAARWHGWSQSRVVTERIFLFSSSPTNSHEQNTGTESDSTDAQQSRTSEYLAYTASAGSCLRYERILR